MTGRGGKKARPVTGGEPTVVALATPPGAGGLAVVRLSGSAALAIARRVFSGRGFGPRCVARRAYLGLAVWPDAEAASTRRPGAPPAVSPAAAPGRALDQVVLLPFRAPHSYTGEDVVELHCHGGRLPADRVLRACLAAGARAAGPGEFTRRAFLNGRLSLDQAEAVADLIAAENDLAADAALSQLRGGLDARLAAVEGPLRELLADLEGGLEFGEQEEVGVPPARLAAVLDAAAREIAGLLALAPAGRRLREGVGVVLAGAPNVGKSSLLNALLGAERAIVDPEPGTTRDVVSEVVDRAGVRFRLQDTAGLRPDAGRIESEGIRRGRRILAEADVVLVLREAAGPDGRQLDARQELARLAPGVEPAAGAVLLSVGTKADLLPAARQPAAAAGESASGGGGGPTAGSLLLTSAVTGEGLPRLWDALLAAADREPLHRAAALGVLLNARHRDRLESCARALGELRAEVTAGPPPDEVIAGLLAVALADLGEVTGRVFSERLLGDVFSRFCVGK